ncbi:MAG: DNA-3-methyladenine glycosylase [Thermaerobacter sp.]|nr:DNA-3-methyladenine glycosylase [Thermaerobacter sp.]
MEPWRPVSRQFFAQPTEVLAENLLGMILVHESDEGPAAVKIVEVEMYRGPFDKGAHSYGGRPTPRTQVMFGPPGHAYIYFIYGMYYCFNVVAAEPGAPEAILIRAGEPVQGLALMARRRQLQTVPVRERDRVQLARGPGRLAQALGLTKAQYGWPLWQAPLYIAPSITPWSGQVARGPRINIGYADEAQAFPWRFWVKGHPAVSK